MKAIAFYEHGGIEVLQTVELPVPDVGRDDVLVRVRAVALNHLDLFVREGLPGLHLTMPHILGSDIAGEVAAVGGEVTGWQAADRVILNPTLSCGTCALCLRGEDNYCRQFGVIGEHVRGGYAQYIAVPARNVYPLPRGLPFAEAAAIPLVYATAWRMIVTQAQVRPGEVVLILGIGGGVSSAALQVARAMGAEVWVTSGSDEKLEKARTLGATQTFNYRQEDWGAAVWKRSGKRGVDVVLDNVGEATWSSSLRTLRTGGRLVTCGATTGPQGITNINLVFWRQLQIFGSTMSTQGEFQDMLRQVERGRLRPVVDRVLPLEGAQTAHRLLESSEQFGKIVLEVP
ncbi:MAG: zinc-binding dehydrogenase [Chloroflexi bacterium]|nr:zinc-binding dehydrogenase [Chloroflexota bacterium]